MGNIWSGKEKLTLSCFCSDSWLDVWNLEFLIVFEHKVTQNAPVKLNILDWKNTRKRSLVIRQSVTSAHLFTPFWWKLKSWTFEEARLCGNRKSAARSSSTPIMASMRCCMYISATLGASVPVMPSWCWTLKTKKSLASKSTKSLFKIFLAMSSIVLYYFCL